MTQTNDKNTVLQHTKEMGKCVLQIICNDLSG